MTLVTRHCEPHSKFQRLQIANGGEAISMNLSYNVLKVECS